jgi:hypothetical protein
MRACGWKILSCEMDSDYLFANSLGSPVLSAQ